MAKRANILNNNPGELIQVFKTIFRGRDDVVPKYWIKNTKDGEKRTGYSPICKNIWKDGVCPKREKVRIQCIKCPGKDFEPISDELLTMHIEGECRLGVYPLLKDNSCHFIAADFDDHQGNRDPLRDVKEYYAVCRVQDVPCYVLRSKSGNGYHVYIFFEEPVPAWKARLVAFSLLKESQAIGEDDVISSFDRLFPNQDELASDTAVGNLIALPFQGKAMEHGNTLILNPDTEFSEPFDNQLKTLNTISRVTEDDLNRITEEWDLKRERAPVKQVKHYTESTDDQLNKLMQCKFIEWVYENQVDVTEPYWYSMLTNVANVKPGGVELCHILSREHPSYSREETDDKILHALNDSSPHSCKYIKENGFDCGQNCGVKAPIVLVNGKSSGLRESTEVNLGKAREVVNNIIELSKNVPKATCHKILHNQDYVGSLALVSEKDMTLYEATLQEIRNNGVKVKDVETIRKVVKNILKKKKTKFRVVRPDESAELIKARQMIKDAPVPESILIPFGWELSYDGGLKKEFWEESLSGEREKRKFSVSPTPILIVGRLKNVAGGTETIKLTWYRDGGWRYHTVERKIVATEREIPLLADYGVTVTSINAKDLVEFLAEFEAVNINTLPCARVSTHFGWQDNKSGFLIGRNFFKSDGTQTENINIDNVAPEDWKDDWIVFKGKDDGNDQIADGFYTEGSYEVWIDTVNSLFTYPKVISVIYFSLMPPLLDILGAENFTVDWAYSTSTGKTTTLRVGGSCWGNPNENSSPSIVYTWDATKVWIERAASILNGLPLILDDTKLAGTGGSREYGASKVSKVVYQIASGKGRGRGSIGGIQTTGSWRTILLSTGEQAVTDFTVGDGGSRARVISIWGLPFGQADETTRSIVKETDLAVKDNFGHAGRKVIQFILSNRDKWDLWKNAFNECRKHFAEKAGSNPVAIRISDYFATLALVIPLVHAALPELRRDYSIKDIIDHLWDSSISGADEADRSKVALHSVYSWAVSNQTKFWHRHQKDTQNDIPREPFGGWAGSWRESGWEYIAFKTEVVRKILKEEGFDTEAVLKTWKERDWLESDRTGRGKQVRIDNAVVYCYCIKRSVIKDILGIDLDGESPDVE